MDPQTVYDPLLRDVPLPLGGTFYALGFRIDIVTNSQAVLDAAAESWGAYGREFESRTVELHIIVRPEGECSPDPVVRTQRHYFSLVGDQENFGAYDCATFFGYSYVSEKTVAERARFRFHFLETMAYMLLAQRYVMPVHAACVALGDRGVLLYGLSGAGKSTLAWACARSGWTYVTDDGTWLLPEVEDGTVLGQCRQIRFKEDAPRLFPELAGFAAFRRPNGKMSLEVPLAAFPEIRTVSRCRAGAVVVLDRQQGAEARVEGVSPDAVAELLLNDMPRYGKDVRSRYESVVRRLVRVPCWRLTYGEPGAAVDCLRQTVAAAC